MSGPRIALVGGGARSGKSSFALIRARELGGPRAFLATAQAFDDEMARRIAEHARTRGPDFETIEEPLAVVERLVDLRGVAVVVIDCLTLWLSNLLLRGDPEAAIASQVDALAEVLARRRFHAVVVTNEVGMGLVPETPLGRVFRDVTGRAHQVLAAAADEIYLGVLGSILQVRPEPVRLRHPGGLTPGPDRSGVPGVPGGRQ